MKRLYSMVLHGIQGISIDIEIDIQRGLPGCTIVGLGDASIQESRERIRSAIKNSGFEFPKDRITCNLAPAHIRKTGSHFDLALSLGMIFGNDSAGMDTHIDLESTIILGELALSGEVRRMIGALPIAIAAIQRGWKRIILPKENLFEVQELHGIEIIGVSSLIEAISYIQTGKHSSEKYTPLDVQTEMSGAVLFEHIRGHERAKRALVIAAAGGHNILLEGPPGSGKGMLASALSNILPELTHEERMEVAQIYSVAGLLREDNYAMGRPFRQLHPSASSVSILGGGRQAKPGEISLAHTGVLFLDEFLEFDRSLLESLREPLESRKIKISRSHGTYTYPAGFMLVGAMNPCPCGYHGDLERNCTDSTKEVERYREKISGPILDRIDLQIRVPRVHPERSSSSKNICITTESAQIQVKNARDTALRRSGKINSFLLPEETENLKIEPSAREMLIAAVEKLFLSLRAYHRILRVARTIADIEQKTAISEAEIAEALGFR